jgi:hypothetical protein
VRLWQACSDEPVLTWPLKCSGWMAWSRVEKGQDGQHAAMLMSRIRRPSLWNFRVTWASTVRSVTYSRAAMAPVRPALGDQPEDLFVQVADPGGRCRGRSPGGNR